MVDEQAYLDFCRAKENPLERVGFDVLKRDLHGSTFDHQADTIQWALRIGRALIAKSFGLGKCHGAETKILMSDGSIKNVEDVYPGECLMGDDSTPRRVLSIARGQEQMYKITLKNGDSYTCNESHIMSLNVSNGFYGHKMGDIVNMSVRDYLQLPEYIKRNGVKHYKVPVSFPEQPVPMEPYLYGAWLGDGHRGELTWTINNDDIEIVNRIKQFASDTFNMELVTIDEPSNCQTYAIRRDVKGRKPHCDEFYFVQGSENENGKFIDSRYLQNSREIRLQVLAGLIDTDGHLIDNVFEIATKWEQLRDQILYLARSLGFSVTHKIKTVNGVDYYRIWISGDTHLIPCITRKKADVRQQIKRPLVYGFKVEPLGIGDYYGFEIDGNHLYLLGDFTVTHNTHDQIEIAKQVYKKTGKPFLIICPLGVKHQFQYEDGPRLGVNIEYITSDDDFALADTPYLITNYERVRDGGISQKSLDKLGGVSLDEGAVLRALDSKTWDIFFKAFKETEFRFVCTATPSPNNYIELLNYAVFLGKIDRGFALTRWFKRDSQKAGNLTLHQHHEEDFWLWVSTWALFLYAPSDLGYPDGEYVLPELNVQWHRLSVDHRRAWKQTDNRGQHRLLLDAAGGISEATEEKRATMAERVEKAKEIIATQPEAHWLIWHHLEDERKMIQEEIPEAVTVWGTMNLDEREKRILDFSHGEIRILATKPTIAGSGCNFQRHCWNVIYLGLDYKFHDFIQSLHRVYRFQQYHQVNVHIIYAESEDAVVRAMQRKWNQHDKLTKKMQVIIKKHGLNDAKLQNMMLKRKLGVIRQEVKGMKRFTAVNNDCVMEMNNLDDNTFDMIMTSIPFGNHYEYTEQEEDFGHSATNEDFFKQMDFLTPELLRVLKPGRIAGIHVKDRILYGHQTPHGFMEISPFSDDTVAHFRKHGFMYEGRRTLVKDVVAENNQTYRLGYTEMTNDATKMGSGLPEYILLFRKPPTDDSNQRADEPVTKDKAGYSVGNWQIDAHQFWRSNGNVLISQGLSEIYDYDAHVQRLDALENKGNLPKTYFVEPPQSHSEAVWADVQYMHCLNSNQARRRVEQHICPLPLDIVRRMIRLYSNEDDLILDPFAGLFTVPVVALDLGRRGYGIELNPVSFKDGLYYCEQAEKKALTPTLFDWLERVGEKVQ